VGAPLKGAQGRFILRLEQSRIPTVISEVTSDESGKAQKLVSFERCTGGYEAKDYVSYDHGSNTWRSYYYVGGYHFSNLLWNGDGSELTDHSVRSFGHICKQRLMKSTPGPR